MELRRERPSCAALRSWCSIPVQYLSAILRPEGPVSYRLVSMSELFRIKRAERETAPLSELRGYCSFRLQFLEGLLICEQRWIGFSICRKNNNLIRFRCSLLSVH
jgi:hypothetical protein